MNAKAAIFTGAGQPMEIREFPITATPAGYGRSDLIASGVCGTDNQFYFFQMQTKGDHHTFDLQVQCYDKVSAQALSLIL